MSTHMAAPETRKIVPAFLVKKVDDEVTRDVIKFTKEGKKYIDTVKEPFGYLVSFPAKGHSIRVRNAKELSRLGFDRTIPLVDSGTDNDDVLGSIENTIAA